VGEVPEHVTSYREDFNTGSEEYAEAAARKDAPTKRKEVDDED
jgi:hypothetical protein